MIIAIDPGRTTGIATARLPETLPLRLQFETFILPIDNVMEFIDDKEASSLTAIVVEYFATAGRLSKYGLETIDLVGQIKGWCLAKGVRIKTQSPVSRRAWIKPAEDYLKGQGKYVIHQVDALSHLLQYIERELPKLP